MRMEFKLRQRAEIKGNKKESRGPVAKEVGMGNPAEKTTRHPTRSMFTEDRWVLARDFFENFLLRFRYILANPQVLSLVDLLLGGNQLVLEPAPVPIHVIPARHKRRRFQGRLV